MDDHEDEQAKHDATEEANDCDASSSGVDAEPPHDDIELTPEQAGRIGKVISSAWPPMALHTISIPDGVFKNVIDTSKLVDSSLETMAASMKPILDAQAAAAVKFANSALITNLGPALAGFGEMADRLTRNIDLSGIAASLDSISRISANFVEQQSAVLANLGPALAEFQTGFYPANLRDLDGLEFELVDAVVMGEGVALYGVPRMVIAEELIRAESSSKRREIIGRRWKTISADCREVIQCCSSDDVVPCILFANAALDALEAGHVQAAQALAGSLVDTLIIKRFGNDRYNYTPNRNTTTTEAYDEFTIREYLAFAPMWQTYQQFFPNKGDKIPLTFSRHATAHAVSRRQYSRRNAVQGLMFACTLLLRLDEEARSQQS